MRLELTLTANGGTREEIVERLRQAILMIEEAESDETNGEELTFYLVGDEPETCGEPLVIGTCVDCGRDILSSQGMSQPVPGERHHWPTCPSD